MQLFLSERLILDSEIINGGVLVSENGTIETILSKNAAQLYRSKNSTVQVIDCGSNAIMAGIVDSHVHVNEPGRTDWEGFETATKAAAAGGITTIVDMPLNSIPPTTTVDNLKTKVNEARGKTFVDVAFWGGIIPGNQDELAAMIEAGVVGFKCFMCPSGVDEFPNVSVEDIEIAMKKLENTNSVFAFHAEVDEKISNIETPPTDYMSFLKSRPSSMELAAIKIIADFSLQYKVRTHIVHLSASEALPLIHHVKVSGAKLTVETCHHYLTISSDEIPTGATQYKCCPPIRDQQNQEVLWKAVESGLIDMVVSDHSPCTADLKLLDDGDFLKSWGGIASLQFGLSLFWTNCKKRGLSIHTIGKYMSRATAQLVGLPRKGRIAEGFDADFVVWDPDQQFVVENAIIFHKNKVTPYMNKRLYGGVIKTYVSGKLVYDNGKHANNPTGKLLINI